MRMADAQTAGQKRIHRSKAQFAPLGAFARVGDGIQQPLQLGAGKIGVGDQPRAVAQHIAQAVALEAFDQRRGAAALPDNGVVEGLPRLAFPQKRGFALVGDAHGFDIARAHAAFFHRQAQGLNLTLQNVLRPVFHPAGLGIDLRKFNAVRSDRCAVFIEDDRARTGRTLIQRRDVFHAAPSPEKRTPRI